MKEDPMETDKTLFLQAWTGGLELDDAEAARLLERFRTDAVFRADCVSEMRLLGMCRAAQSPSLRLLELSEILGLSPKDDAQFAPPDFAETVMSHLPPPDRRILRFSRPWLSWRPLAAAAAGILLGAFCTSVGWAIASPRPIATTMRLSTLIDGSFEGPTERVASGLPVASGQWSGDEAEIVRGDRAGAPDGRQVLRFVRADADPVSGAAAPNSCDVYQIVDLSGLKAEADSGEATLELSAQFLDARDAQGAPVMFLCKLAVFSGSPDTLKAQWPLTQTRALGSAMVPWLSRGGSPRVWNRVSAKVVLPATATFALVHIIAHQPEADRTSQALFGEQYADDVTLKLKIHPPLPVRVAQP